MKIFPLLFCLVLLFAFAVSAQTNQESSCPTISISGGGLVERGEAMMFTANIDTKGKDLNLKYIWTVSGGKIINGQGTLSISVEWIPEQNVTATIEVEGFSEGCSNTSSETQTGDLRPSSAVLVDEFGTLPNGEIKARTDAFFVALGNEPNSQGYIINYGTNKEITRREQLIRNQIALRKYDASRITFVRGGANPSGNKSGVRTKFWIVPPGATVPEP